MCNCGKNKVVNVQTMIDTVGSSQPYLELIYCAYPTQMKALLKPYGFDVNRNMLPQIANIMDNGLDVKGQLRYNGQPVRVNILEVLKTIDTTKKESNNCSVS